MSTPCPICRQKQAQETYKPFCSKRCADVDLGRWLNESYRIPVKDDEESDVSSDQVEIETRH